MRRLLFLAIFGLAGTGLLVSLGLWQVQRLAWKQEILAQIDARIGDAPVALPETPDPDRDRYLAVTASGTLEPGAIFVLVSAKQRGAGYRVIAPFVLDDGRRILLDRGFVPVARKESGVIDAARALTVVGNLHWPQETDSYTPAPDLDAGIWFARDVPAMAAALGTLPVLLILRDQPDRDTAVSPLPLDTAGIPNDHLQYAITWFSLAVIWAGMTATFLWRTRAKATG